MQNDSFNKFSAKVKVNSIKLQPEDEKKNPSSYNNNKLF